MSSPTTPIARPPLRVGLGYFNAQSTYVHPARPPRLFAQVGEQARRAEELGFDSFWVGEHHFAYDGYCPSPIPALAHVAGQSAGIALGSGVMVLPLHGAAEIAHQCAALCDAAPGRLRIAVAVGYANIEFRAHRVDLHRRGRIVEERLDELLSEHAELFAGTELWMGGGVPAVARRAGRYGASLYLSANLTAEEIAELRGHWESELRPRPGQQPRVAINGEVWVDDDPVSAERFRAAVREAKTIYDLYFEEPRPWAEWGDLDRDTWLDMMAAMVTCGPADQIVERFAPQVEAGADDVIIDVQHGGASHEEVLLNMARIARYVVPQLPATS
jgi:alkanesulfonate monooxygenase SsuD/methylene tetrahydromethanopterin reductase-like flavin-dependent oxidoreductase (luciferase family)